MQDGGDLGPQQRRRDVPGSYALAICTCHAALRFRHYGARSIGGQASGGPLGTCGRGFEVCRSAPTLALAPRPRVNPVPISFETPMSGNDNSAPGKSHQAAGTEVLRDVRVALAPARQGTEGLREPILLGPARANAQGRLVAPPILASQKSTTSHPWTSRGSQCRPRRMSRQPKVRLPTRRLR